MVAKYAGQTECFQSKDNGDDESDADDDDTSMPDADEQYMIDELSELMGGLNLVTEAMEID